MMDMTTRRLEQRLSNTPDFTELNLFSYIPLFVYGRARKNRAFSYILNGCPFLGESTTMSFGYEIIQPAFVPLMTHTKNKHEGYGIVGETYLVDSLIINKLDTIIPEGRAIFGEIKREKIAVWLNEQPKKNEFLQNVQCYFIDLPKTSNHVYKHGVVEHAGYNRTSNNKYKMVI